MIQSKPGSQSPEVVEVHIRVATIFDGDEANRYAVEAFDGKRLITSRIVGDPGEDEIEELKGHIRTLYPLKTVIFTVSADKLEPITWGCMAVFIALVVLAAVVSKCG